MKRVEEREWVFKIIFKDQFDSIEDLENIFNHNELNYYEDGFIYKSLSSYIKDKENIQNIILNAIGENSYKRLSKIDKAIISLSINETKNLSIPTSVSINEAVNLSKKYSTQEGFKFVNSVLGLIDKKGN